MKSSKNISDESVDVFTWRRHGDLGALEREICRVEAYGNRILEYWMVHGSLEDKVVLDAGCGGGNKTIALALASRARLVIGVDGSESAIAAARNLAEAMGVDNVVFVQAYMEDILDVLETQRIEQVDLIFNSFNLHHVEDFPLLLSVFSRALKPGGHLLTIYNTPDRGFAHFLITNKIAYHLGGSYEGRMRLGKRLFGWFDKRWMNKMPGIEEDSFWADRYSAFYRIMPLGIVKRVLREVGFEIVESKPSLDIQGFLYRRPRSGKARFLIKMMRYLPLSSALLTFLFRIYQFATDGDTRSLLCVRTRREDVRAVMDSKVAAHLRGLESL